MIAETIANRPMPSPLTFDWFRWLDEFLVGMESRCPIERGTTYYVDATLGDDGNPGTEAEPWQTIAKVNTEIAAWDGSAGGLAILLKRGETWTGIVGINIGSGKDNVTVGAYGTGVAPHLNAFATAIPSGSSWGSGTNGRHTTTINPIGWVREVNDRYRAYRRVANPGEVETTDYSWFHDGATTLHLRRAGDDPESLTGGFECTLAATTDDSGIDVVDAEYCRIDGIRADGWGLDGGTNQEYGIKFQILGTQVGLVSNCSAHYNDRHNLGHNGGGGAASGGLVAWCDCRAGYVLGQDDTPWVSYVGDGEQEALLINYTCTHGALPVTATRANTSGTAGIVHTDAGAGDNPALAVAMNCLVEQPTNGFGCTGGISLNNFLHVDDPADSLGIIIGTRMPKGIGTGNNGTPSLALAIDGTIDINSDYYIYPLDSGPESAGSFNPRGYIYNGTIVVDLTNSLLTDSWFGLYNPSSTSDPRFRHCAFHILSDGTTDFGLNYDINFDNGAGNVAAAVTAAAGTKLENSIFAVHRLNPASTADVIRPSIPDSAADMRNNAYFNLSANGTAGAASVALNADPVYLTQPPEIGGVPALTSPLVGAGLGGLIEYDKHLAPRSLTAPTIGPAEYRSAILVQPTVTELQSGLATAAALQVVDTLVDAIVAKLPAGDALILGDDTELVLPEDSVLDAMGIAVPASNLANSIGDCLNAARAQAVGKWTLDAGTRLLRIYSSDGTTVVGTLQVAPSLSAPLTRTPT